jgi:hypothetical protein
MGTSLGVVAVSEGRHVCGSNGRWEGRATLLSASVEPVGVPAHDAQTFLHMPSAKGNALCIPQRTASATPPGNIAAYISILMIGAWALA